MPMDAKQGVEPRSSIFKPANVSANASSSAENQVSRQVTIYLIDEAGSEVCPFWVGLAGLGQQRAGQLLDLPSTAALLAAAATHGLNEDTPIVLADTTAAALRSILLMPPPAGPAREHSDWVSQLSAALLPWHPPALGIYLAPEALAPHLGQDFLSRILRAVVEAVTTQTIYLLTYPDGTHEMLNMVLKLKAELQSETISLHIFH